MSQTVIFQNVTKKYKMYKKSSDKLLDVLLPQGYGDDFFAVQNISFTAEKGDVIGIIGVNGAGKSTLSNLITGVIPPSSGNLDVKGDASLIAIASGLNNQLTGRENIELKCLMLGFSKEEIEKLMPEIIEFADIGHFIDQPVKNYSSGMKSRLGFAISVNIDPDVLVIDEALSVGDQTYYDRCMERMNEFKEKGKTIFFISHSLGQVKKFCKKALWLEAGEVKDYGPIDEVMPKYENFLKDFKKLSKKEQKNFKQMILERRSKEQAVNTNEKQEDTEGYYSSSRENHRKKKSTKRRKRNKIMTSLITVCILAIIIGLGVFAYERGWFAHSKTTSAHEKTAGNASSANKNEEKTTTSVKDLRVVTASTTYARSDIGLESGIVETLHVGQVVVVKDLRTEDKEQVQRAEIELTDSQTGWVTSKFLQKLKTNKTQIKDQSVQSFLHSEINLSTLEKKIGHQIESNSNTSNVEMMTNDNSIVNELKVNLSSPTTSSDIKNKLGKPIFESSSLLIYNDESYIYVFHLTPNTTQYISITAQP